MEKLIQEIKNCKRCELYKTATNKVIGKGSFNPTYLFIGEAPGEQEDLQGLPFCGPSGKLLDKWINFLELDKNDYAVINCLRCRPPNNANPTREQLDACYEWLMRQIELLNPEYIFLVGSFAAREVGGFNEGITSLTGKHFEKDGKTYFPIFHPAYILRNGSVGWQEPLEAIKQFIHDTGFVEGSVTQGQNEPEEKVPVSPATEQLYTPLHVHTTYSIGDSPLKIPNLVTDAKDMGFDTLAITDHGTVCGWFEFQQECLKSDIKPILGVEFYVTDSYEEKSKNRYHLVALAKNDTGMHNILKLVDISNRVGYYFKPLITLGDLYKYKEGLIVTTACAEGVVAKRLVKEGNKEKAEEILLELLEEFGEDVFLELQPHEMDLQYKVNTGLIELSEKHNVPLVITTDAHFIKKPDYRIKIALNAISYGTTFKEANEKRYGVETNYLFETDDMLNYSSIDEDIIREAMANTIKIGEKCNAQLRKYDDALPKFTLEEGKNGRL
jgi:uracil-DNA glycosylase family 4